MSALSLKVDLKPLNTFSVSATADALLRLTSLEHWPDYQQQVLEYDQRLVLGGGSNVLFVSDFPGLIIKPELKGIELLEEDSEQVLIRVGAAEPWHPFVLYCIKQGWHGLENLSLIPGSVGAAPVQNIGAYGVEVGERIESVRLLDIERGSLLTWQAHECQFGYRDSRIKRAGQGRFLVTDVTFRLRKRFVPVLDYGPLKTWFENPAAVTASSVSEAVCRIRNSKIPLPENLANAGSFFKNPLVSQTQYEQIKRQFPDLVAYSHGDQVKLAAGWLIDKAGLKGRRFGAVGVHSEQALVLVNYGGGSGQDILAMARQIQDQVNNQFGVMLEPEVRILGQA